MNNESTAKEFERLEAEIHGVFDLMTHAFRALYHRIHLMEKKMAKTKAELEAKIANVVGNDPVAIKKIVDDEVAAALAATIAPIQSGLSDTQDAFSDLLDKLISNTDPAVQAAANAAKAALDALTTTVTTAAPTPDASAANTNTGGTAA